MTNKTIGKAIKVPVRELWEKEDKDFTVWLEKNIDYLNETLGTKITITAREKSAGDFKVDLVGEDENSQRVIIENQLEKTDHGHWGQIITYISMVGAKTAIWISSNPRDEHIEAIEWLNESTPQDMSFYLIQLEAIRIGDSAPAPIFTVKAGFTELAKESGNEKRELAERHFVRKAFWTQLLEKAKEKTDIFNNISPRFDHWVGIGGGKAGMAFNFTILNGHGGCELYLDKGRGFDDLNKERFDNLYLHKDEIEKSYGGQLVWERLDNRRASRIKIPDIEGIGLKNQDKWHLLQGQMIDSMIKLKKSIDPHIRSLK